MVGRASAVGVGAGRTTLVVETVAESPAILGTLATTSVLYGATTLSLETDGSVCLVLARAMVPGCCSAGLDWAGAVVLTLGGGGGSQ